MGEKQRAAFVGCASRTSTLRVDFLGPRVPPTPHASSVAAAGSPLRPSPSGRWSARGAKLAALLAPARPPSHSNLPESEL